MFDTVVAALIANAVVSHSIDVLADAVAAIVVVCYGYLLLLLLLLTAKLLCLFMVMVAL